MKQRQRKRAMYRRMGLEHVSVFEFQRMAHAWNRFGGVHFARLIHAERKSRQEAP